MSENMTKLRNNVYIVRTQAGYRKAVKDFHKDTDPCDRDLRGYPKSYPSLVILSSVYNGGCYITCCKSFHMNELRSIVNADSRDLYLVERTDENNEHCWGQNLSMVVCASTSEELEELIAKNIIMHDCGEINLTANGLALTKEDIKVTVIGKAKHDIKNGILIVNNAGT